MPVTGDEIYVAPGLMMLMGIVQKPTLKNYSGRDAFLESPSFLQSVSQNQFELIIKYKHATNKSQHTLILAPQNYSKLWHFTVYSTAGTEVTASY
jgi:hypothetical protein